MTTPTTEEINKTLHLALGLCWHKPVRDKLRLGNVIICRKCKMEFLDADTLLDVPNPDYTTSLDALVPVEAEVKKRGLGDVYMHAIGSEIVRDGTPLSFFALLTAPADIRARALAAVLKEGE